MARDNSPQKRQSRRIERKEAHRASYDRILIVSEGSKTEPNYFQEIKQYYRLQTANIKVFPSELGTDPIQVVQYAKQLFELGDSQKNIQPRTFEQVFAVFDRDEHSHYFDALKMAESLDKKLKNDTKQSLRFHAIASVPSFELWLLLHYEDIRAPIDRKEVLRRLKTHIPNYEKGMNCAFGITKEKLPIALQRAQALAKKYSAHSAPEPFTAIFQLVELLTTLKNPPSHVPQLQPPQCRP